MFLLWHYATINDFKLFVLWGEVVAMFIYDILLQAYNSEVYFLYVIWEYILCVTYINFNLEPQE